MSLILPCQLCGIHHTRDTACSYHGLICTASMLRGELDRTQGKLERILTLPEGEHSIEELCDAVETALSATTPDIKQLNSLATVLGLEPPGHPAAFYTMGYLINRTRDLLAEVRSDRERTSRNNAELRDKIQRALDDTLEF